MNPMQVTLANPRGFCAGVDRAIEIVDRALEVLGAPIYVRHEVVHNRFVVNNLREKGAVFVQELDEVPDHATVIFSAHGVSRTVQEEARQRGLKVFDATCPLVTKVHVEVTRYGREGRETILIGHKNHPEVEGTMGQYETRFGGQIYRVDSPQEVAALEVQNPEKLAFVTQTTLSVDDAAIVIDALRAKFPAIVGPKKDDICYATQNRQDALKQLARIGQIGHHRFGHAVVQQTLPCGQLSRIQISREPQCSGALNAQTRRIDATVVGDVSSFGRPRGNGA